MSCAMTPTCEGRTSDAGLGQCGACKVIINGAAVFSCITPVASVKGEITTLEGVCSNRRLHPVQQAWIAEQAPQCGFCQNGQIITAKALLDKRSGAPSKTERKFFDFVVGGVSLYDTLGHSRDLISAL